MPKMSLHLKRIVFVVFTFVILLFGLTLVPFARADDLDDIASEISKLQRELDGSMRATKPLEEDVNRMKNQITLLQAKIQKSEETIAKKELLLTSSGALAATKKASLDQQVFSHYKNLEAEQGSLFDLILSPNLSVAIQEVYLHKSLADVNKKAIIEIFGFMNSTEDQKKELEKETARLAVSKQNLLVQSEKLDSVLGEAKTYQKTLSNKIASLSAKQQQLLAAKLGSLNLPTSLGAGPLFCTDDRKIDPGFGEGFAAFTFGIPHRIGMNQYGAYGRAKAGQDYKSILNTYFANFSIEKKDPNMKIKVKGFGEMSLDTYLLGIYEMPGSWPIEALKAQVVAARSYALSYTKNGANEICTTQACQVYKGGNKGGDWERAVKETEGEYMVSGGEIVTGWFASTSGGYTFQSGDVGWSNKPWTKRVRDSDGDVGSFDDLFAKAYDRDSPCFYSAQGSRKEFNKSAWLKPDELADIINILLLAKADSSTQNHLSQLDKPNPDGTDTWDKEKVKSELRSRGKNPYSRINSISVGADFVIGKTNSVSVSGDAGSDSFDGQEFRSFFNLRAPGNISIVGPLFRFEKR